MERKIYLPSGEVLPDYWNEMGLVNLCRKFAAEIGNNTSKQLLPPIRVRYVLENNKFAYADFGDYFFWADNGLYVWHKEEKLLLSGKTFRLTKIRADTSHEVSALLTIFVFA